MYNKDYVLRMLDLLGDKNHKDLASIEGIFAGVGPLCEDSDVCDKLVEKLKKLVEDDLLSASEAEKSIKKYFSPLVRETPGPVKTFVGPFANPPRGKPLAIDFSRMGKDWIHRYSIASPEERNEITRPYFNAEQ